MITATGNHPFWIPSRGWIPAERLTPGTRLHQPDGLNATVAHTTPSVTATVYNLTVAVHHNYYVGTGNRYVLVHNDYKPASSVQSNIGQDPALVRFAKNMGRNEKTQKDMDHLVAELSKGNRNPGLGNKTLCKGAVIYARTRDGARLFHAWEGDKLVILAKANKANEPAVIKHLQANLNACK